LKNSAPYIIAGILVLGIIALIATGSNKKNSKQLDERITLRKKDKIPYGTYVAFENLQQLFPKASISTSRSEPGYWDSLSNYDAGQAFIAVTDRFNPYENEMKRLISFAEKGNDVFVSARYLSSTADKELGCSSSAYDLSMIEMDQLEDNMNLTLSNPPFDTPSKYTYPGRGFYSYFTHVDTSTTDVLGYDKVGRPVFIHLRAGKGNFYVHLEPLAFSNYFLLYKNNISYYEKAMSVIDPAVTKVVWDEYYLNKRAEGDPDQKKKGWMSVLMSMQNANGKKPFKAAFWLLILLLLLYVLMEMRRKQRYIPVVTKPKNDSLDFIKTIGRLYYDKGDHKNLCRKMGAYFLEHVRGKYKLPTGSLNDEFVKTLQYKSGADEHIIRGIISFIKYADDAPAVTADELADFHKQLELFYKIA